MSLYKSRIPEYKKTWSKTLAEKISLLHGENDNLPKVQQLKHKQIVAKAYDETPKPKKAPLA
mgnify:CR=1 FL=1